MGSETATTPGKMTAEAFFEWANRPENAGRRFELDRGEVIEMSSPGEFHGYYCWLVIRLLTAYVTRRGTGYLLTNDTGLVVRRNPDTVRGPDVMCFLEPPDPSRMSRGHCNRTPQLVVEVLSPTDRPGETNRRIEQYLRGGVPLVWLIDPEDRTLTVYRPKEFHKVLDPTEELTGNGVLPEFSCRVADLFALPGQPPASPVPPTTE